MDPEWVSHCRLQSVGMLKLGFFAFLQAKNLPDASLKTYILCRKTIVKYTTNMTYHKLEQ